MWSMSQSIRRICLVFIEGIIVHIEGTGYCKGMIYTSISVIFDRKPCRPFKSLHVGHERSKPRTSTTFYRIRELCVAL